MLIQYNKKETWELNMLNELKALVKDKNLHKTVLDVFEALIDQITPEGVLNSLPATAILFRIGEAIKKAVEASNINEIYTIIEARDIRELTDEDRYKFLSLMTKPNSAFLIDRALEKLSSPEKEYRDIVKSALRFAFIEDENMDYQKLCSIIDAVTRDDLNFVFFHELPLNEITTKDFNSLSQYFDRLNKLDLLSTSDPYAIPIGRDYELTETAETIYNAITSFAPSLFSRKRKSNETLQSRNLLEQKSDNGITFDDRYTIDKASAYLSESSFYFRVAAYRENWKVVDNENTSSHYSNLDFSDLVDLEHLDEKLRNIILFMTLSIEQQIKTILMDHILRSEKDGFQLAESFLSHMDYSEIIKEIRRMNSGSYSQNLVLKYAYGAFPVWALVETLSFGNLLKLTKYYYKTQLKGDNALPHFSLILDGDKKGNRLFSLLDNVRRLRNAAAHNSCLINDLRVPKKSRTNKIIYVVKELKSQSDSMKVNQIVGPPTKTNNRFIHDFVCLLLVYFKIMPEAKKEALNNVLSTFDNDLKQILYNDYYGECKHESRIGRNNHIMSSYKFLSSTYRYLKSCYSSSCIDNKSYDAILMITQNKSYQTTH